MPEIRRVVIIGYSGQNPYILVNGTNPWQEMFKRMNREASRAKKLQENNERRGPPPAYEAGTNASQGTSGNEKGGKTGVLVDIEGVIEQNDRAEQERRRVDEDKIWKENEGLLSGEMV